MQYPEIHIWDFPPSKTYIRLNDDYREKLIRKYISHFRTNRVAVNHLNNMSSKYGEQKHYCHGQTANWIRGRIKTKNRNTNVPLWAILEMSMVLANSENADNNISREAESNIGFYCGRGYSTNVYGKFPLHLTPELVSAVFHLCGDGFLADKPESTSSYRQVNHQGLMNFAQKLQNSFGHFEMNQNTINNWKILIPRVISDFYKHYFQLGNLRWNYARIPKSIKAMPKNYLLAGLTSFMIDEGHIGDNLEIYSGNIELLEDIREIAMKIGYSCNGPYVKAKTQLRDFRLYISLKSVIPLSNDIKELVKEFPTCDFAHKQTSFDMIVKRNNPASKRGKNGVTKQKILALLSGKQMSTIELCTQIIISPSTLKEHLRDLEKEGKVKRIITDKKSRPYWQNPKAFADAGPDREVYYSFPTLLLELQVLWTSV